MNKKKLTGFGAVLAAIAATFVASRGGGSKPVAPPVVAPVPTYTLTVHVCKGDCVADHKISNAVITVNEAEVGSTDGAGNLSISSTHAGRYTVCAKAAGFTRGCVALAVPTDGDAFLGLDLS